MPSGTITSSSPRGAEREDDRELTPDEQNARNLGVKFSDLTPEEKIERLRYIYKAELIELRREIKRLRRNLDIAKNHQHSKNGDVLIKVPGEPGYDYPSEPQSTLERIDSDWL